MSALRLPDAKKVAECALGLGGNVGNAAQNLDKALDYLRADQDIKVIAVSTYLITPPWGDENQSDFTNACALIETTATARQLLEKIKAIEQKIGRTPTHRWGPREIDIDILTYGDETVNDTDLIIPHPFMSERDFVMAPLAEIAPDLANKIREQKKR